MKIAIATNCPPDTVNYIAAFRSLGTELENVTDECDPESFAGLVLPGGADVDPSQYGAPNTACGELDPELDRIQMKTLKKFLDAGKPVFGICRGQQLLNVFFGGTLIQNLPAASLHARDQGVPADKIHHQTAVRGSLLEKLYGTSFVTNSSHHQAVDMVGKGLKVTMLSDEGYVEALEHESLPVFSVQWHPERMCFSFARPDTVDGSIVLKAFLEKCGKKDKEG